ncbi:hypothetical protein BC937DRAFT_86346 [Endogone sp. FLAS-F59071]|nr:hypothetical protein BC937DRAFT_86346 [Endogone sp. FLAS-F59071]|eukprot:RUS13106.1 hypothetical protein BC937DRAFT_86346 [Endogone sp. FLAS-F59071]
MTCIGLFLPYLANSRGKTNDYVSLPTLNDPNSEVATDIEVKTIDPDLKTARSKNIETPINHRALIMLASLDVVANFLVTVGFFYIGSGMYQVIYSSVVIWCAIFSYFFMGRRLTTAQWVAIFGTSAGLTVSTLGSGFKGGSEAGVYVLAGHILTPSPSYPVPSPFRLCFWIGFYCLCYSLVWVIGYTLPRRDELFHLREGTSIEEIGWCYAVLAVASLVHAVNYYELIEKTGPVSVGVLNGLRAILVFGLSHYWYCETDTAQCFTVYKGWGSTAVVGCVLLYTMGGRKAGSGGH